MTLVHHWHPYLSGNMNSFGNAIQFLIYFAHLAKHCNALHCVSIGMVHKQDANYNVQNWAIHNAIMKMMVSAMLVWNSKVFPLCHRRRIQPLISVLGNGSRPCLGRFVAKEPPRLYICVCVELLWIGRICIFCLELCIQPDETLWWVKTLLVSSHGATQLLLLMRRNTAPTGYQATYPTMLNNM